MRSAGCNSIARPGFGMTEIIPSAETLSSYLWDTTLVQLRVFSLRLFEDRNVRVGVFPKREEILIGHLGFGGIALHRVGASEAEMRERPNGRIQSNSAMVEDFLELGSSFAALMRR